VARKSCRMIEREAGLRRGAMKMPSNRVVRANCQRSGAAGHRVCTSGRAAQADDRQLLVAVVILDFGVEPRAGLARNQCVRSGTRRTPWPSPSRFDPRFAIGWETIEI